MTVTGTDTDSTRASGAARLVLVTGASGAGRSTATAALEDLGFEAIDNMPLGLLPRLLGGPAPERPLAVGIDVRNRDFAPERLVAAVDDLAREGGLAVELLFLDCRPDVLANRYSETRRRHPVAPDDSPEVGIAREIDILAPVRTRADVLLDTSDLTPHDLRGELTRLYGGEAGQHLAVTVESFSYKRGLPRALDTVFDVRFLANPHWQPELRPLDGRSEAVKGHVSADPYFAPFFDATAALILMLLPAYKEEGKAHIAIGFGCTGGQHRSVAVAGMMAERLAAEGWQVSLRHRELERRGLMSAQAAKEDRQ